MVGVDTDIYLRYHQVPRVALPKSHLASLSLLILEITWPAPCLHLPQTTALSVPCPCKGTKIVSARSRQKKV